MATAGCAAGDGGATTGWRGGAFDTVGRGDGTLRGTCSGGGGQPKRCPRESSAPPKGADSPARWLAGGNICFYRMGNTETVMVFHGIIQSAIAAQVMSLFPRRYTCFLLQFVGNDSFD